jgi:uncharacterized protein (TIGR00162 family)
LETFIKERRKVSLRNPILIGGFPGLGSVGKIAITYLKQQLKAKPLADLYSPYFPHHVVVSSSGRVRLPRAQFYLWKNPQENGCDLILVTGDSQAQGFEGQYTVVEAILNYAGQQGAKTVITIGGFRIKSDSPERKVVSISSNRKLIKKLLTVGAERSPVGNPVVGFAGLTLGLSRFRKMKAGCLLGETVGYMPDIKAAKAVLKVLRRFLGITLDMSSLDKEIKRTGEVFGRMDDVQSQMEVLAKERAEIEGRQITYIS